jgi:hypothetical protein
MPYLSDEQLTDQQRRFIREEYQRMRNTQILLDGWKEAEQARLNYIERYGGPDKVDPIFLEETPKTHIYLSMLPSSPHVPDYTWFDYAVFWAFYGGIFLIIVAAFLSAIVR